MAQNVNLDALIPRDDFRSDSGPSVGESSKSSAATTDLVKGEAFFSSLRKPDFQRETMAWSPDAIAEFVRAFIESDLIPTVICWQSRSRLSFVIDGAHRLSAVIAWIMDDYGDGAESQRFYNNSIPLDQIKIAKKTRLAIDNLVGSYRNLKEENTHPGTFPLLSDRARGLPHAGIPLQWIKSDDARKAEKAFFTINQSAVKIDPTELKILNARTDANAVAARAIVRNATGHKYWNGFSQDGQVALEKIARQVYATLYSPALDPPIRTSELPIAGHGYGSQTLPLIFDFINIANGLPVKDPSKEQQVVDTMDRADPSEEDVLRVARMAEHLATRFTGKEPQSLGLLPAVYFYAENGRHQPTSVLAMAAMLKAIEQQNKLVAFATVRYDFEEFLLSHKSYVNQIQTKYGSMAKGYRPLQDLYLHVFEQLLDRRGHEDIEQSLLGGKFAFLTTRPVILSQQVKKFSSRASQIAFISESLQSAPKCPICKARKDNKAITADHKIDKKDGGLATTDNLQFVHPFCNSAKDAILRLMNREVTSGEVAER